MRDTLLGVVVTATVIMPVAILGATGPMMRDDLQFGEGTLGAMVSVYFLAGAVASIPAGRIAPLLGLKVMIVGACLISGVTLVAVPLGTSAWLIFLAFVAGGVANASGQVAVNQWLALRRPANRQGLAFGAKQAAVPLASVAAGLLLPLAIVPFGWRAGFLFAAVLALFVVAVLITGLTGSASSVTQAARPPGGRISRRPETLLAGLGLLAATGGTCLAPFLVDYLTTRSVPADAAGLVLAVGAATGISVRILAGVAADRLGLWPLSLIAILLGLGVLGIGMLAVGSSGFLLIVAVMLAFGGAWGWPGLLPLALARSSPDAFAGGVGTIVTGQLAGSVIGPALFGVVVQSSGYPVGWTFLVLIVGSAAVLAAAARLRVTALRLTSGVH